ncbi:MAG: cysteine desulfurase [Methanothrix sp.]|nr:cysteine desulfurase [Methanothrix sp.]
MEISSIRSDFPILEDVIYLDSASTSLTPEPVLQAMLEYYRSYRANVGRGVYRLAQIADQRYRDAHRKVSEFIDGRDGALVFARNTTEAINIVARGIHWRKGDGVVTTLLEHHSNLLPWLRLGRRGIRVGVIRPSIEGLIDPADLERALDDRTRLVAVSQLSNALGTLLPIKEISGICRERGVSLLVDAAQSVPHMPVSVKDIGCDFLCFSGHKMLGPTGTGALWMRVEDAIEPLLVGGGMVEDLMDQDLVVKKGFEGFEAGTPNISGGIGLGSAVDYLRRIGMEEVHRHEMRLTRRLLEGLSGIRGVEVHGNTDLEHRGGLVSFSVSGLLPQEVAMMLDHASRISVRSGHHCCIPLMRHLGLEHGTVRASVYLYNTEEDIDRLLEVTEQIAGMGRA